MAKKYRAKMVDRELDAGEVISDHIDSFLRSRLESVQASIDKFEAVRGREARQLVRGQLEYFRNFRSALRDLISENQSQRHKRHGNCGKVIVQVVSGGSRRRGRQGS